MRLVGAVLVLVALAGCSPYRFGPGVRSFASSVEDAGKAGDAGYAALRRDFEDRVSLELRSRPGRVELGSACAQATPTSTQGRPATPCLVARAGAPEPVLDMVFISEGETRRQMRALRRYSGSLVAITSAEDRSALDAAVDSAAASAGAVATAGGLEGAAVGAAVAASFRVGGFLLGEALDARRLRALKAAVDAADPAVEAIAVRGGANLDNLRRARLRELRRVGELRANRVRPGPRGQFDAELEPLVVTARAIETLRKSEAEDVGPAIAKAHGDLRTALNAPSSADAREFAASVDELAQRVADLREALSALSLGRE
jgi:hypothetical protein